MNSTASSLASETAFRMASESDLDSVFPLVYGELKRIAQRALSQDSSATLNATALVHEAYERLAQDRRMELAGRRHFFALCARAMRQIVIDHARRRSADKRGGGPGINTDIDNITVGGTDRPETLVALHEALEQLSGRDPRLVELIELRVFAGLEPQLIAELRGCSVRSVQRDWLRARVWIGACLDGELD